MDRRAWSLSPHQIIRLNQPFLFVRLQTIEKASKLSLDTIKITKNAAVGGDFDLGCYIASTWTTK